MRLFGRVRSGNAQAPASARPLAVPQSTVSPEHPTVVLGSPKDKYGMMGYDEKEISPAHNGMQAMTRRELESELEPERYETRDESPETVNEDEYGGETTGDESPTKKKKKKKKKKGKKKKKSTGEGQADDDAPLIIDRVPTAMEYESDDSIEKMIDERSRYSRYTT
eukprot:scaffold7479_cov119-Amphora_coffeaeformis.AAC.3